MQISVPTEDYPKKDDRVLVLFFAYIPTEEHPKKKVAGRSSPLLSFSDSFSLPKSQFDLGRGNSRKQTQVNTQLL
jgi:hypothetical protein